MAIKYMTQCTSSSTIKFQTHNQQSGFYGHVRIYGAAPAAQLFANALSNKQVAVHAS